MSHTAPVLRSAPVAVLLAVVGLIALPAAAPPASASAAAQSQTEVPPRGPGPEVRHPQASKAIDMLWSPYCPGMMLEVCPSGGGAALRDTIQGLAEEEGWSSDEIVDWVLANHGEEYLALPRTSGTGFLAWILPPLGLLLGLGIVIFVLRRMQIGRRAVRAGEPEPSEPSAEEERRLQIALEELDAEEEAPFL